MLHKFTKCKTKIGKCEVVKPDPASFSVDKNSIKAVKEGNHREVYRARKKLEKEGFSWSEKS